MNKFLDYYKEEKKLLNEYIDTFNKELLDDKDEYMKEYLSKFASLNSGGKLIRGTLINLGYEIMKGKSDYSYPLALAYEVFQTSILLHDDIIDKDDLRREKETIHSYISKKYNDKDLGNNIAICVGDYGLYKSNYIISNNYIDDINLGRILNYFNEIVLKTIKGEILDVITPFKEKNSISNNTLEDDILKIYEYKTSYYTIIGPLSLGLLLGGIKEDELNKFEEFGKYIGIAFQIQDDLLGIYGDNIGKNIGTDIKEFKTTILYSYTKNTKYYRELLKYYGNSINEDSLLKVRDIFKKSGAYDYSLNIINKYYEEARNILDKIDFISNEYKNILLGFIDYLEKRDK